MTELRVGGASIGHMRGKTGDRREAIDVCNGQVRSQAGLEVAMHLHRQQRMAAHAEEVVVHAHTVDPEHALERVGDMLCSIPGRRHEWLLSRRVDLSLRRAGVFRPREP